jgi:hypothetical protein
MMTKAEKEGVIKRFEASAEPFLEAVRKAPWKALDFRPKRDGAWTIREHLAHFLDADAFAYARLRLCAAEPGATVFVWDEEKWAYRLEYGKTDLETAITAIKALRAIMASTARALADRDWDALYVEHPKRGKLTVADVLNLYAEHAAFHLDYVNRNLQEFPG